MAKRKQTWKVLDVTRDPEEGHFVGRVKVGSDVLIVHARHGSWKLDTEDERYPMREVLPDVAAVLAGKARQVERAEGKARRHPKRRMVR